MVIQFTERQLARQQLIHHHAERENIGCRKYCRISSQTVYLLRGHISIGSENLLGTPQYIPFRHSLVSIATDSKICQSSSSILLDQHVFRFKVPMYLTTFVQIVQPTKNLPSDFDQVDRVTFHILGKIPFRTIVHNDKRISALQPMAN